MTDGYPHDDPTTNPEPEFTRADLESAWEHAFEVDDELDLMPDEADDYGYLDRDDGESSEYSAGYSAGYIAAQERWFVWMNRYRLMNAIGYLWRWRKAHLRWKWHDFRRFLKGKKTDDSDIPF
jgi:hypothetical protein